MAKKKQGRVSVMHLDSCYHTTNYEKDLLCQNLSKEFLVENEEKEFSELGNEPIKIISRPGIIIADLVYKSFAEEDVQRLVGGELTNVRAPEILRVRGIWLTRLPKKQKYLINNKNIKEIKGSLNSAETFLADLGILYLSDYLNLSEMSEILDISEHAQKSQIFDKCKATVAQLGRAPALRAGVLADVWVQNRDGNPGGGALISKETEHKTSSQISEYNTPHTFTEIVGGID